MSVERKDIYPPWTRSFSVSKQPNTIGEHLRKIRFNLGIRQSEAARRLGVSKRTLSLWETDQVYPTWSLQPGIVAYFGYNPFTDPALGKPRGNESADVAFLLSGAPASLGQKIAKHRVQMRKNRKECAKELGVNVKTLLNWETNRRQPSALLRERIAGFLGFDPSQSDS